MKQLALSTLAILSTASAQHVLAADYGALPDFRLAYSDQWAPEEGDPLSFETGVRYWYSIGKQEHSRGPDSQTMETKTHSGEVFARVNDASTNSFVEAFGGYGVAHEGTFSTNGGASKTLPAARLGYAGLDFAWMPLGNDTVHFGMITGYQYTNDSPDTGRANFSTARSAGQLINNGGVWQLSGGDSEINNFEIHNLKLGVAGKFDAGAFDIFGEAAAIPYSWVTGTYGAYQAQDYLATHAQASAVSINGHGYGASGKLMVGFRPTENLSIRVGGRASYLTGQYDVTWDEVAVTQPVAPSTTPTLSRQTFISNNNPFSMLRYGALLEVSGSF
ncbi:hypothetical protein [Devosia sp.]|uniref:hypothetical protein n=1 Tax=Devosia sp. TaxID=1871048 RepID=UPI001AD02CE7|nr:hypothetical protein [Devosia sp.]MBN9332831.1 hypothetical protein [Devosia sp.]